MFDISFSEGMFKFFFGRKVNNNCRKSEINWQKNI